MSRQVSLTLSDDELHRLREVIAERGYRDEEAALREALRHVLEPASDDREHIAEAYRRAYAEHPEENWVGEAGARLMAESVRELESTGD